jgi:hypothetical protein
MEPGFPVVPLVPWELGNPRSRGTMGAHPGRQPVAGTPGGALGARAGPWDIRQGDGSAGGARGE